MEEYEYTFEPTTLDLLLYSEEDKLVQVVSAFRGKTKNSNQAVTCKDLDTGQIVDYPIGEFDIIPVEAYGFSIADLEPELQEKYKSLDKNLRIKGTIVKRE